VSAAVLATLFRVRVAGGTQVRGDRCERDVMVVGAAVGWRSPRSQAGDRCEGGVVVVGATLE